MGNVFHQKGKEIYRNEIKLSKELLRKLEFYRKNTLYEGELFSNYLELRPGMLNFSVLGRNCPFSEREKYYQWDIKNKEREQIAKVLNEEFSDENLLSDSLDLLFELIFNPNVENNKFDSKSFNIIKDKMNLILNSEK